MSKDKFNLLGNPSSLKLYGFTTEANTENDHQDNEHDDDDDEPNPFSFKNFIQNKDSILPTTTTTTRTADLEELACELPECDEFVANVDLLPSPPIKTFNTVKSFDKTSVSLSQSDDEEAINFKNQLNGSIVEDVFINNIDLPSFENHSFDTTPIYKSQVSNDPLSHEYLSKIKSQQVRIEYLEARLKELEEKDRTENSALEHAIQQVEKNLVESRARVLESEKNVVNLKQENVELRAQLATLANENSGLKSVLKNKTDLTECKLEEVSYRLNEAANEAEKSLKSLMIGVDMIRLVAESVKSVAKIHEVRDDNL
jgi:hypothetical protein